MAHKIATKRRGRWHAVSFSQESVTYQRFPTVLNTAVKGLHVGQAELLPLMVSMAQGKVETYP